MGLIIPIAPKRITQILVTIVLFFILATVAVRLIHLVAHDSLVGTETLIELFAVNMEKSIPTWFSSSMLLICSGLIATIALAKKAQDARYVPHWKALSVIFLFLSLDDAVGIHELLGNAIRYVFPMGGFLHSGWVIPGFVFVLMFVLVYLRFLTHLPLKTRYQFIAAWSLLLGGAVGGEIVGDYFEFVFYGKKNLVVEAIWTLEELLEMMGVIVFIYGLMSYINSYIKEVRFSSDNRESSLQLKN